MTRHRSRGFEIHEHSFVSGPRAGHWSRSRVLHSHEGSSTPHEHPNTGPASYTIDKDEWARATGMVGGGRRQFTRLPSGEQIGPPIPRSEADNTFQVIYVGDGGAAVARGAGRLKRLKPADRAQDGGGIPTAMRLIQQLRMKAVVRRG